MFGCRALEYHSQHHCVLCRGDNAIHVGKEITSLHHHCRDIGRDPLFMRLASNQRIRNVKPLLSEYRVSLNSECVHLPATVQMREKPSNRPISILVRAWIQSARAQ